MLLMLVTLDVSKDSPKLSSSKLMQRLNMELMPVTFDVLKLLPN